MIEVAGQCCAGISGTVDLRKTVAAAEVVLGARAADRGKLAIAIDIELDLPFSKPAWGPLRPSQKRPGISPFAPETIQDDIRILGGSLGPTPLGMEIAGLLGNGRERIGD